MNTTCTRCVHVGTPYAEAKTCKHGSAFLVHQQCSLRQQHDNMRILHAGQPSAGTRLTVLSFAPPQEKAAQYASGHPRATAPATRSGLHTAAFCMRHIGRLHVSV